MKDWHPETSIPNFSKPESLNNYHSASSTALLGERYHNLNDAATQSPGWLSVDSHADNCGIGVTFLVVAINLNPVGRRIRLRYWLLPQTEAP